MKIRLSLLLLLMTTSSVFGKVFDSNSSRMYCGWPDSTDEGVPQDSAKHLHWVNIELMGGQQFFGTGWAPYSPATFLGMSGHLRLGSSSIWLDGSIVVAWAGETDADGHRAGPGTSYVELRDGVGHWWYFGDFPLSCYAGGGLTYVWGSLELPDKSKPPLPISEFLGRPVYPDMQESGDFWGGYFRCGLALHVQNKVYFGIGGLITLTTNRILLDRSLDVTSSAWGVFIGIEY